MSAVGRWVTIILAVVLGAFTLACESEGGAPDNRSKPGSTADVNVPPPANAPNDWPVGDKLIYGLMITVFVEPDCVPFTVTIDAQDYTTGERISFPDRGEIVHDHYWTQPFAYPAHDRVTLNIHVKASKPSHKGYIAVREGPRPYARMSNFNGTSATSLTYESQRP